MRTRARATPHHRARIPPALKVNGKICRVASHCPLLLLFICIGLLISGMGKWPIRSTEQDNDCGGAPCCWNKTLLRESSENPAPLTGLQPQSYAGKVVLWDPENRWIFSYITEQTCRVTIRQTAAGYVAESDIYPQPVPLTIQMHPGSPFYMGTVGDDDVFIFQSYPGGGSFTHTTYDDNGEVEYGKCGAEQGFMIKACDVVE